MKIMQLKDKTDKKIKLFFPGIGIFSSQNNEIYLRGGEEGCNSAGIS